VKFILIGQPTLQRVCSLTVHPVPAPPSTKAEPNKKVNAGGINQKLKLFKRGKAISAQPNKSGNNQLPKPPI